MRTRRDSRRDNSAGRQCMAVVVGGGECVFRIVVPTRTIIFDRYFPPFFFVLSHLVRVTVGTFSAYCYSLLLLMYVRVHMYIISIAVVYRLLSMIYIRVSRLRVRTYSPTLVSFSSFSMSNYTYASPPTSHYRLGQGR